MKLPRFWLSGLSLFIFAAGCVLKPVSPRASVDPTPPEQRIGERNFAESKLAYEQKVRDRALVIERENNLSSYSEAEMLARKEIGPAPTGSTQETTYSSDDQRAAQRAKKSDKYHQDLESVTDELSEKRAP